MNRRTHTTHIIITNFSAKQNSLSSSFYYCYYSYSYSYSYRCSFRFTTIQTTTIAITTASSSSSLFAPLPAPLIISSASRWPRARLYLIFSSLASPRSNTRLRWNRAKRTRWGRCPFSASTRRTSFLSLFCLLLLYLSSSHGLSSSSLIEYYKVMPTTLSEMWASFMKRILHKRAHK